ncbi:DUF488 domain-containing protein [Corallococcus sp. BB11-1]|uniref:DUF488 domain-containing protein n=1 Tax=Corallococcus sp. BB11-1 TaxID=2996783 RepID=UPI0022716D83|nr:DUF488 domain-containing protein [Corallococcus sp. BB11-1]MCY1035406.1 DUF488 domain-containing protein [Corallococcus sp. BB11-1]
MTAPALFTLGYAGLTLLADVRRNPFSREKGFSQNMLAQSRAVVGIRDEHLPGLGIASVKRKGLATQADVNARFAKTEAFLGCRCTGPELPFGGSCSRTPRHPNPYAGSGMASQVAKVSAPEQAKADAPRRPQRPRGARK